MRRAAWCDICAVAMSFGPWAMGFKRYAARHYVVIGAFGALRCARLLVRYFIRYPGLRPGIFLGNGGNGVLAAYILAPLKGELARVKRAPEGSSLACVQSCPGSLENDERSARGFFCCHP